MGKSMYTVTWHDELGKWGCAWQEDPGDKGGGEIILGETPEQALADYRWLQRQRVELDEGQREAESEGREGAVAPYMTREPGHVGPGPRKYAATEMVYECLYERRSGWTVTSRRWWGNLTKAEAQDRIQHQAEDWAWREQKPWWRPCPNRRHDGLELKGGKRILLDVRRENDRSGWPGR